MKKILFSVLILILTLAIGYGGACAILWETNPAEWPLPVRALTVSVFSVLGFVFIGAYYDVFSQNKP